MRTASAFLAGIGLAYLFDPRQGRRRRHVLRDRTLRALRRAARLGVKRTRFAAGHLRGLVARARRTVVPPTRPVDDQTVAQRIRSDALRDVGASSRDVEVLVREGVAVLRGTVDSRSLADDLVDRVRAVPGVRHVEDGLQVAGETATARS